MKEINLEKIIDDNNRAKFGVDYSKENGRIYYRNDIKKAMLVFGKQLLELAAENAELDRADEFSTDCWVNKQSIINTIKQVKL